MKISVVQVPGSLLLDRRLPGSARLLWIIRQLSAPGDKATVLPGCLQARSGLTRHTVLRGLARLEATGWLPAPTQVAPAASPGWVFMPGELLMDSRLGVQARLLYGALQLTPGFRSGTAPLTGAEPRSGTAPLTGAEPWGGTGQFTYAELCGLTGLSPNPVRLAVGALEQRGWLQISQPNRFRPIRFALGHPAAQRRQGEVAEAARRLEEADFVGEALMREYLSLLVDSEEYQDNASPGFLVNPFSGERLQLDRYYPPRVAFEFNGSQHYGPTAMYPKESDAWKQQGRDYIKMGICVARGIELLVVQAADLSLDALRRRVNGLLPLRDLDDHAPLIEYLEAASRGYRRRARDTP